MITVTHRGDHDLLTVVGPFDLRVASMVSDLLQVAARGDRFVVDLGEVTRVDSDAVGELMTVYRRARSRGVELRFDRPSSVVRLAAARNVSVRLVLG